MTRPDQQGDAIHEPGDHHVGHQGDITTQTQHTHHQQQPCCKQQCEIDEVFGVGSGDDSGQPVVGHADDGGGDDTHRCRGPGTLNAGPAKHADDQGDDAGRDHARRGTTPRENAKGSTQTEGDEADGESDDDVVPDRRRTLPRIWHRVSMCAPPTAVKNPRTPDGGLPEVAVRNSFSAPRTKDW